MLDLHRRRQCLRRSSKRVVTDLIVCSGPRMHIEGESATGAGLSTMNVWRKLGGMAITSELGAMVLEDDLLKVVLENSSGRKTSVQRLYKSSLPV